MKFILAAALFSGLSLTAFAQTGPAFPKSGQASSEAGARRNSRLNADELARNQRRAAMTPDEIKRDQQMELLEARTGNTSFGRTNGPERQFDKASGGFMVRKFKSKTTARTQKRGMTQAAVGANPKGKPLVRKRTNRFF
jgi:hypothetical protein